ncbi:hypothetical protein SESBI_35429 [Sesbania bispinosa]|nr:hypothetical protein SESBI_35429 [Sesbania bispinosa]
MDSQEKGREKEPTISPIKIVSEETYNKILRKPLLQPNHDLARPSSALVTPVSAGGKDGGPESVKALPHGIQTVMNVEVVSANHLRFVEEPKPPDLNYAEGSAFGK